MFYHNMKTGSKLRRPCSRPPRWPPNTGCRDRAGRNVSLTWRSKKITAVKYRLRRIRSYN